MLQEVDGFAYRWATGADDGAPALLFESAGTLAVPVFGMGSATRALDALATLFAGRDGIFSHETAVVAERDGDLAALIAFCRLSELRRRNLKTVAPMFRAIGSGNAIALLRRGRLPTALGPRPFIPRVLRKGTEEPMGAAATPDDYYIAALAVDPGFRRRGLASQLVGLAERIAQGGGGGSITVNVLAANAAAANLYRAHGYRTIRQFELNSKSEVGQTGAILSLQKALVG